MYDFEKSTVYIIDSIRNDIYRGPKNNKIQKLWKKVLFLAPLYIYWNSKQSEACENDHYITLNLQRRSRSRTRSKESLPNESVEGGRQVGHT